MRTAALIAWRDVRAFFLSPIAYVLLTVWLFVQGLTLYLLATWYATQPGLDPTNTPLSMFFGQTSLFYLVLIFIAPVLTMRLFAEERRTGTIEPLRTAGVGDAALVAGKYAAGLIMWAALWAPTLLYVWIISRYGRIDPGVVASSYVGVMGTGLYYIAIGLLMSAVTRNQIVAAVLTFLVLALLFLGGVVEMVIDEGPTKDLFGYISLWGHMADFAKGIVDTRRLVFDGSLAALALFLCVRVVESWRHGS
ncbi:MAG: ABC transporter permease [Myxococcota bacterium]|nr:ABC transporter permease [Myxococcota bacterium]MDW8363100.1 ABC transporter permease [Myxococcales bacterium]